MRCLRCGINMETGHSFCQSCREFMDRDPVPRDARAVIIPRPKKAPPKPRPVKPEVLLLHAKKKQKILGLVCLFLVTVVAALALVLFLTLNQDRRPLGQTYQPIINQTEGQP